LTSEISIGRLGKPHGLTGALRFFPSGDLLFYTKPPLTVRIGSDALVFEKWDFARTYFLVHIRGILNLEMAKQLTNQDVHVPREALDEIPIEQNEVLVTNLIGLKVYSLNQSTGFHIYQVLDGTNQTFLDCRTESTQILVPFLSEFVGSWDLEAKTIEMLRWEEWFEI